MPELLVSDIAASIELWCYHLGFAIAYERPEDTFAYLERPEGAQIMLSQPSGKWETAPLDRPTGAVSCSRCSWPASSWSMPLYAGPREVWREVGHREAGQREIFVLDPGGYLIMVAH